MENEYIAESETIQAVRKTYTITKTMLKNKFNADVKSWDKYTLKQVISYTYSRDSEIQKLEDSIKNHERLLIELNKQLKEANYLRSVALTVIKQKLNIKGML